MRLFQSNSRIDSDTGFLPNQSQWDKEGVETFGAWTASNVANATIACSLEVSSMIMYHLPDTVVGGRALGNFHSPLRNLTTINNILVFNESDVHSWVQEKGITHLLVDLDTGFGSFINGSLGWLNPIWNTPGTWFNVSIYEVV